MTATGVFDLSIMLGNFFKVETTDLSASLLLWMGTLTGRLVASRKSVISFRLIIFGCTERTSIVEEEREKEGEEEEEGQLRGEEGDRRPHRGIR